MRKRLVSLASMVPLVNRVIDAGCDHALLDIYLGTKYQNTKFLAIDISSKALESARKNVISANLESRIEILQNDGLKGIELKKDDFIVISGLGTNTITRIVSERLEEIENVLIQSNRDLESLRQFMFSNGFTICDEKVVFDDSYYVFIHFKKENASYDSTDLWLGPIIKNSENKEYFEFLLKRYKKILSGIPDNDSKKSEVIKRVEILDDLLRK